MHACGVCSFLNVWKRQKEGERNHIFGEITSRMWYWVHFTDGNRSILSALPRSGNEGQIVLVVWKWVRNNPSKVKKLVNRDPLRFHAPEWGGATHDNQYKTGFLDLLHFFLPTKSDSNFLKNIFLLGPFKTFMPNSSNALRMEPCTDIKITVSSHHMHSLCVHLLSYLWL